MGYMRHHAVLVCSWDKEHLERAYLKAKEIGLSQVLSKAVNGVTNGYRTFMVAPDGSKEGWDESNEYDSMRDVFVAWLDSYRYGDGSSPLDWCLVQFGDEDHDNRVLRHEGEISTSDDYSGPALAEQDVPPKAYEHEATPKTADEVQK